MPIQPDTDLFRQRAQAEAARYGSDSWVFLRELLQNARDAGARRIEMEVSRQGDDERLTFRDDGSGMSQEHARRYLFALYASSKEQRQEQAGKFGIGFWSVLRFEPSTILIRSRPQSSPADTGSPVAAWQVVLDGDLGTFEESAAELATGTEIVLERPVRDGEDLAEQVMTATRHYGRFLTRRGDVETPLPVTVNGRSANAKLKLAAPSARFRGKGFRGAVGLGPEPKVELFAQGLFVRSAPSLQDLQAAGDLGDGEAATTQDVLSELPSLAPQVVIDSAELDLLLARSDARHDRHLKRLLSTAEKQLGRLITRQLQALKPQPFYRLWWGALRDRLEPHVGWPLAWAGAVGLVLGVALLSALASSELQFPRDVGEDSSPQVAAAQVETVAPRGEGRDRSVAAEEARSPTTTRGLASAAAVRPFDPAQTSLAPSGFGTRSMSSKPYPYTDLADLYDGPRSESLAGDRSQLAMFYEPPEATPFFAALIVDELAATRWTSRPVAEELPLYQGSDCRFQCVESQLLVAEGQRSLRLPIPTGHRLDAASVRFNGESREVYETASGEALLRLPSGAPGAVEYRTGRSPAPRSAEPTAIPRRSDAPAELVQFARQIRPLPAAEKVQRALDFVVQRVAYDRSPMDWSRYRSTGAEDSLTGTTQGALERSFVDMALEAGAGDCDVQSGVLVTLLRLAGTEARLALGYVGTRGIIAPGLHAWVEVREPDGRWSVADPSVSSEDVTAGAPLLPAPPDGIRFPSTDASWKIPSALPWAAALLLGAVAWTLRRRSGGRIELDSGEGRLGENSTEPLAALLGGALRHPEAFAGLSAMFHGRFVPLLERSGGLSLAKARRLGSRNRLFRSKTGSSLARRAAARGVAVIDASTPEGQVLSLALGAIDVDHWSTLLEANPAPSGEGPGAANAGTTDTRSTDETEMTERMNRQLKSSAAGFRLRVAAATLPDPWVEIALDDLRLGDRQILIDLSQLEYAPVRALAVERPAAAAFTLLDVLLHRIEVAASERARILSSFAREAVAEAAPANSPLPSPLKASS